MGRRRVAPLVFDDSIWSAVVSDRQPRAVFCALLVLHEDVLHTIVLTLILGAIVWTHRD